MRVRVPTPSVLAVATAAAAVAALAASSAGCQSSGDGRRPARRPGIAKPADEPIPPRPVVAVRKIAFIDGQVAGYLTVHEDWEREPRPGREPARVYWVHDSYFKVLGFYTERGDTYRALGDGGFQYVGKHDVDVYALTTDAIVADAAGEGVRVLLRAPRDLQLQLIAMDAPRTLESDAAAKATAAPAATPAEGEPRAEGEPKAEGEPAGDAPSEE